MPPRRAPPARSAPPARQPDWRAAGPVGPGRRGGAGTPLDAAVVARSWPPGRGRPLLRSEAARAVRSRRSVAPARSRRPVSLPGHGRPVAAARSRPSSAPQRGRPSRPVSSPGRGRPSSSSPGRRAPPRAFRTRGLAPTYPYQRVAQASVASPACQSAIADGLVGQRRRTARGKGGFRRSVNSMGRAPRLWAPQRRLQVPRRCRNRPPTRRPCPDPRETRLAVAPAVPEPDRRSPIVETSTASRPATAVPSPSVH
jgi:hypothetical protein